MGDGIRDHEQGEDDGRLRGRTGCPGTSTSPTPTSRRSTSKNGGKYVVVHTESGVHGGQALRDAAGDAARTQRRACSASSAARGSTTSPYRTADGRYDPAPASAASGSPAEAEVYTPADRIEQPTLAQMTEAALTVLARRPDQPFALFIEAGDVDFALHANNLDNAVGAVYSGEDAIRAVIHWVEKNSNWDDSLLLVSSDHGHYLVVDDPQALAGAR